MKDIFETSVWELGPYLSWKLTSIKAGEVLRVLDWTDSLDGEDAYGGLRDTWDSYYRKCIVETFAAECPQDIGEDLTFHTIRANGIGKGCYDLVVLRRLTAYDNGIDDVVKRAAKALKDGGVLYANLVITSELEHLFKAAEKNRLYPAAASKIAIETARIELMDDFFSEDLELYDMQGYVQLAFRKGMRGRFRYTEAALTSKNLEENYISDTIMLKDAAFDGIWCVLTGKNRGIFSADCDPEDEFLADHRIWIRASQEIDADHVRDLFPKMKEDSWSHPSGPVFPGSEKIRFSDYFEVDTPHHTKLSELDTSKHYYLSPSNPVHCLIDNLLNADQPSLPEDVLRRVNFNNIGNIFDLINEKGELIPDSKVWSGGGTYIRRSDYYEDPPKELYALNNIARADIDIPATLLYNLIRITPKGKRITLDYLKMFFFVDERTQQKVIQESNQESNQLGIDRMDEGSEFQAGRYAINYFSEHHFCQSIEAIETKEMNLYKNVKFDTYTADDVARSYIFVDEIKKHRKLIEEFQMKRDPHRAWANVLKRFADNAFMDDLHRREDKARSICDPETVRAVTNTERLLEQGEADYDRAVKEKREAVSLLRHLTALEVFLKLCLACCSDRESLDYEGSLTRLGLGGAYHIYLDRSKMRTLLKSDADEGKYHLMLSRLKNYKKLRNDDAHTGAMVRTDLAEDIIKEICDTLAIIAEIAAD